MGIFGRVTSIKSNPTWNLCYLNKILWYGKAFFALFLLSTSRHRGGVGGARRTPTAFIDTRSQVDAVQWERIEMDDSVFENQSESISGSDRFVCLVHYRSLA